MARCAGSDSDGEFEGSPSPSASNDDDDDDDDADAALDEEEEEPRVLSQAEVKARNVRAMISGALQTARTPLVSGLKCQDVTAVLARPFKVH
jgi:DNA repair and recombination RAD54-like protein